MTKSAMPKGIFYILIATFAFAWMNINAKYLSDFHPMQVVFFRAIGTYVFVAPFMAIKGISFVGYRPKLLLLRGVVGVLSLSAFFWAVQRIPVGSAISIRYVAPFFTAFLSIYLLKEKVSVYQWLSFFIAFLGVLLLKGVDARIDLLSLFAVLFSALSVGLVFVLVRMLAKTEKVLTIIHYFMLCCIAVSLCFIQFWRWPIGQEWIWVSSIGVLGLIGQVYMTMAFKHSEATLLAPFKYMELIYAVIIGYFFLQEKYNFFAIAAMALIILGMVLNVIVKRKQQKKMRSIIQQLQ